MYLNFNIIIIYKINKFMVLDKMRDPCCTTVFKYGCMGRTRALYRIIKLYYLLTIIYNYTHHKMCRASLATGNCHYYHKSGTNRPIVKTENKLNPSHRASYSNRATPLMDRNHPTHNHPQTTTASIRHLTQHWPSYISHSYKAPAAP